MFKHLCANLSEIFTLLKLTQSPKLHIPHFYTGKKLTHHFQHWQTVYFVKCFKFKKGYCVIILSNWFECHSHTRAPTNTPNTHKHTQNTLYTASNQTLQILLSFGLYANTYRPNVKLEEKAALFRLSLQIKKKQQLW